MLACNLMSTHDGIYIANIEIESELYTIEQWFLYIHYDTFLPVSDFVAPKIAQNYTGWIQLYWISYTLGARRTPL